MTPPRDEISNVHGAYPRLSPGQIQTLAMLGERRSTHAADVLYRAGETSCDFFVMLAGTVAVVEATTARTSGSLRSTGLAEPSSAARAIGLLVGISLVFWGTRAVVAASLLKRELAR